MKTIAEIDKFASEVNAMAALYGNSADNVIVIIGVIGSVTTLLLMIKDFFDEKSEVNKIRSSLSILVFIALSLISRGSPGLQFSQEIVTKKWSEAFHAINILSISKEHGVPSYSLVSVHEVGEVDLLNDERISEWSCSYKRDEVTENEIEWRGSCKK